MSLARALRFFAMGWLILLILGVCSAEFFVSEKMNEPQIERILIKPGFDAFLGTDSLGRDMLFLTLQGAQTSLLIGALSLMLAGAGGLFLGGLVGYRFTALTQFIFKLVEVFQALPSFLLVSLLCFYLQLSWPDLSTLAIVLMSLSLTHWMSAFRVSRALVREAKVQNYVLAAQALGASPARILATHIWPNIKGTYLNFLLLQFPIFLMYEAAVSFIGVGVSAPNTSWGVLMREGWKTSTDFPHLIFAPSLFLFLTVWSVNILFDYKSSGGIQPPNVVSKYSATDKHR